MEVLLFLKSERVSIQIMKIWLNKKLTSPLDNIDSSVLERKRHENCCKLKRCWWYFRWNCRTDVKKKLGPQQFSFCFPNIIPS